MTQQEEQLFWQLFAECNRDKKLDRMKAFIQHGKVTTYDHVIDVAKTSLSISRILRVPVSERELIRGALLHDYNLYDWHTWKGPLHGPYHPIRALENAKRDFALTHREENIIRSHMWPLTLFHPPRTREAVIVCIADKIVSTRETLFARTEKGAARLKTKRRKRKAKGVRGGKAGTPD